MKSKILKINILVIAILLLLTLPTFASEGPTKHTITIEVPANEEVAMPYIWGNGSYSPVYSQSTTASFVVPDNNFAFETNATDINGNHVNGTYSVGLHRATSNLLVASTVNNINGTTKKLDWISTDPGDSYKFIITNYTSATLAVYIEYYSWN